MPHTLSDLSEPIPDRLRPALDRADEPLHPLDSDQRHWREHGYVILPRFLPDALMAAYCRVREAHGMWAHPFPYLWVSEIRDLCLHRPLLDKLKSLIGEELAMHLNLTNWASTERNWHQDDYLNPPLLNAHYAAVWMALDDIHPDSGPFEYVPGSHRWPVLRGHKVRQLLPFHQRFRRDWPSLTQDQVSRLIDQEIVRRGAQVRQFIARKGDVLIWHSCLVHRGSEPRQRGMPRKSLITHYASVDKALHFPGLGKHGEGWYFRFGPRGTNRIVGLIRRALRLKHRLN